MGNMEVLDLTLSVPNFRLLLSSTFLKDWTSNSVDLDETSHLDLRYLQKSIFVPGQNKILVHMRLR